ncbi:MAG TPA: MarR family transcriptional regulator [Candidatus Dormibacteraeota bacterium]|nr:MarR family transcriptional regulator [Candidatus Dormibacteraeota bacterium]
MLEIEPTSAKRAALAADLLSVLPALKRTFQSGIPKELRDELANVTTHQLEALGLLMQLRGTEGGATMQEVARIQGCALSTATALADRLIGHGLAERVTDLEDRRVVKIRPTDRAGELLQKFFDSRRQIALAALSPLSDEEAATLIRLLRQVASGGDSMEVAHG